MGLDMYFYMSKYESEWDWKKSEPLNYDKDLKELEDYIYNKTQSKAIISSYKVGYFRKFNALHNYIVKVFADGEDDCQRIYLDELSKVREMLDLLKSINKDNASELLPTSDGFFFGSQEYDEWYFQDVKNAIELFEKVLKVLNNDTKGKWDFYYQASW